MWMPRARAALAYGISLRMGEAGALRPRSEALGRCATSVVMSCYPNQASMPLSALGVHGPADDGPTRRDVPPATKLMVKWHRHRVKAHPWTPSILSAARVPAMSRRDDG